MNTAQLAGAVYSIDFQRTRNGKEWVKLVLEVSERFGQERSTYYVPIECFGRSADALSNVASGDIVSVSARVVSREYQGKYYVDIKADSVTVLASLAGMARSAETTEAGVSFDDSDLPF